MTAAIQRLVAYELPRIKDRVSETEAWTAEGRKARADLCKLFRRLRRLAARTGNKEVKLGVEQLVAAFKADLPNFDRGGSVN